MPEAKWYVVHTYSGYENKVASTLVTTVENRNLQDMILDVKVPTEIVVEEKDGVEKETEHKLYPGYVFIKMIYTDETWYVVRNIRGCTGFVGPSKISSRKRYFGFVENASKSAACLCIPLLILIIFAL